MRHTQMWFLTIVILTLLGIGRIVDNQKISDKDYALQVLNQYIRYYCPKDGICSRPQALSRLQRDWPHVYKLGFSVLEENE